MRDLECAHCKQMIRDELCFVGDFLCFAHQSKILSDFCGSPGFFAPEILLAKRYNGQSADYWSIGCILLELLVGNKEFESWWMRVRAWDSRPQLAILYSPRSLF